MSWVASYADALWARHVILRDEPKERLRRRLRLGWPCYSNINLSPERINIRKLKTTENKEEIRRGVASNEILNQPYKIKFCITCKRNAVHLVEQLRLFSLSLMLPRENALTYQTSMDVTFA